MLLVEMDSLNLRKPHHRNQLTKGRTSPICQAKTLHPLANKPLPVAYHFSGSAHNRFMGHLSQSNSDSRCLFMSFLSPKKPFSRPPHPSTPNPMQTKRISSRKAHFALANKGLTARPSRRPLAFVSSLKSPATDDHGGAFVVLFAGRGPAWTELRSPTSGRSECS
jgi:hypothetical protein